MKTSLLTISIVLLSYLSHGQNIKKQKMLELNYMIGDWVGMSKSIKADETTIVPAYESIQYQLDSTIIEINLKSETLELHTIIHYSVEDSTYYYQPFSKTGTAKYKAKLVDNKLIVEPNKKLRYYFTLTDEGYFQEYGTRLENGEWRRYFEDTFKRMN